MRNPIVGFVVEQGDPITLDPSEDDRWVLRIGESIEVELEIEVPEREIEAWLWKTARRVKRYREAKAEPTSETLRHLQGK